MTDKIKIELKAKQILELINHLDIDLQLAIIKNVKQRLLNEIVVNDFEVVKTNNDYEIIK